MFLSVLLTITLLLLSATCKAFQDKFLFRETKDSPMLTWRNKWKNGDNNQGERFWGSSRWFVIFTDKWHLFDFLRTSLLICCMITYTPIINIYLDAIVAIFLYHSAFELLFD